MIQILKLLLIITSLILIFSSVNYHGITKEQTPIMENDVHLNPLPSKVNGKITISGFTYEKKLKILITKDSYEEWYNITLNQGKFSEDIWLIDGTGFYTVAILIHIEDRKYRYGPTVTIENIEKVNKFLVPGKDIESHHRDMVNLAKRLTWSAKTDRDKAKRIYLWIVNNIQYDSEKSENTASYDYQYGALHTFYTRKGICYDYSTLVAALGRALGLQTKLVVGNYRNGTSNELHAWNEIYLKEDKRWIKVDTSFAYTLNKNYFDFNDNEHIKLYEY